MKHLNLNCWPAISSNSLDYINKNLLAQMTVSEHIWEKYKNEHSRVPCPLTSRRFWIHVRDVGNVTVFSNIFDINCVIYSHCKLWISANLILASRHAVSSFQESTPCFVEKNCDGREHDVRKNCITDRIFLSNILLSHHQCQEEFSTRTKFFSYNMLLSQGWCEEGSSI